MAISTGCTPFNVREVLNNKLTQTTEVWRLDPTSYPTAQSLDEGLRGLSGLVQQRLERTLELPFDTARKEAVIDVGRLSTKSDPGAVAGVVFDCQQKRTLCSKCFFPWGLHIVIPELFKPGSDGLGDL